MLPSYLVLDLETTGGNPVHDRITEIAAVRIENGQEVARWSSLINPGTTISTFNKDPRPKGRGIQNSPCCVSECSC